MPGFTDDFKGVFLSGNFDKDMRFFKELFKNDGVFRSRNIRPAGSDVSFFVMFMDGMTNCSVTADNIIKPLTLLCERDRVKLTARYVGERVIFSGEVSYKRDLSEIVSSVLIGDTAVLISGSDTALIVNTKGFPARSVVEPVDERVTQGPREGFLEVAMYNLSLIRRRLLTPDLIIKPVKAGKRSNTAVFVCYLGTLADKNTVDELLRRIDAVDIDGVLDSNYLTEHIRDRKMSIFKTIGTTERPDIVAARLLEGRIAVVVDGTPMVLTLPYLFSENFQSDEDYYVSYIVSSVRRLLRYICFAASVSVPALFVALSTFHIELLPTHFAVSVAQLRMGVPISSVGECLLLVVVFEVLKEAGVRMSQSLGHALSIVGGLVVGEAAVQAKIISAPMLIAVAFSGICGLMVPRLKTSVLYIRVTSVILCSVLGLYGFMALGCVVLIHVLNIESFGVDYTVSISSISFQSLKDTVIRAPWTKMIKRPLFNKDLRRQGGKKN
ncbi:MAG: spore germination protein [Clostridia bacterium]|nr:spore germination protein [Clostridia bacterium]